jgi:hypothetical protein
MGGLCGYMTARDATEIETKYLEVKVVAERPTWIENSSGAANSYTSSSTSFHMRFSEIL